MPFCSQCGNQVAPSDQFCAHCGARQPLAARPADLAASISPRTASILCYVPWVGWVAAIVVLASHRFRNERTVRFHAFQGLYLFVAWLIVEWVVTPMFHLPGFPFEHVFPSLFKIAVLLTWIFMLVKVSQGETYHLPIIGDLAERSVSEQV